MSNDGEMDDRRVEEGAAITSTAIPTLEERVKELELLGYEREHRVLLVFFNLAKHIFDEEKRWRVIKAYLSWQFSPGTIAIGAGSVTALLGLILAYQANSLLSNQNSFVGEQNRLLAKQIELTDKQTHMIEKEVALIDAQNTLADSARRAGVQQEISAVLSEVQQSIERQQGEGKEDIALSMPLVGRIRAAFMTARPYRTYSGSERLSARVQSAERATLFIGLHHMRVDTSFIAYSSSLQYADFSDTVQRDVVYCEMGVGLAAPLSVPLSSTKVYGDLLEYGKGETVELFPGTKNVEDVIYTEATYNYLPLLKGASFTRSKVSLCKMINLDMTDVDFSHSFVSDMRFDNSDMSSTDFRDSVLIGCRFTGAILPEAKRFTGASLDATQLLGGLVEGEAEFVSTLGACAATVANLDDLFLRKVGVSATLIPQASTRMFSRRKLDASREIYIVSSKSGKASVLSDSMLTGYETRMRGVPPLPREAPPSAAVKK